MKVKAPWVVCDAASNAFKCQRCGATLVPQLPCEVGKFLRESRKFLRAHVQCLEPQPEPVNTEVAH